MRKFLLALLLLCASPCYASISLVQHKNVDGNTSEASQALAYTSNPTSGNLLVVMVRYGGGSAVTAHGISDTLSNSWTEFTSTTGTGDLQTGWYTCSNASTAADTVTLTVSPNETIRMAIYEYSGAASSSCLDTQGQNFSNSSSTSCALASNLTPGAANELVLSSCGWNTSTTLTAGTSFTLEDVVPAAPSSRLGVEQWIQTTATATTGAMTGTTSTTWAGIVVAFKPSGAAAAPTAPAVVY